MKTVKLYTTRGEFVVELQCMPYRFWPQGFQWGDRIFIRSAFVSDIACEQDTAPPYYEASVFPIITE